MSEKNLYLTIDNGGTTTKVVIHDQMGKQIAVSSFPTKRIEEHTGFREINLTDLWESIQLAIIDALTLKKLNPNKIKAISVVGHGKGLYPLNKSGEIFMHGILSTDERGTELASMFNDRIDQLWSITNQPIVGAQAPVLLNWLKNHEREKYNQIGFVLSAKDFVRFQLTGEMKQEIGDASGNNLVNIHSKTYDEKIFDFFEIDEMSNCMPALIASTNHQATVSENVSARTGIPAGTPVLGGLFDIQACTLATGVLDSKTFGLIAGTWSINVYPSKTLLKQTTDLMVSILPDFFKENGYLIEASSATSAGNLDMMINMLLADEKLRAIENGKTIYDDLDVLLANTDPTFVKMFYLPFLYGSNGGQGAKASFVGLNSNSSKSEMIKAVYEGIAFAHNYHIEQLLKIKGKQPDVIRISGGATNSDNWVQMFSDILGIPIETVEGTELGALGGMILAAYSLSEDIEIGEVVNQLVIKKKRFEPNLVSRNLYKKKYQVYSDIVDSLSTIWNELNETNKEMES